MLTPVRLYRADGDDRVAVVSAESAFGGGWLVRVAVGPTSDKLSGGTTLGPVQESDLKASFAEAVERLRGQGFAERTAEDWSALLQHEDSHVRARAAQRLGWRKSAEHVDLLLERLKVAIDDLCPIVDALGAIGDRRAVDAVREVADRKLLSRRRSGIEALRQLGDQPGLELALERTRQSLTTPIRDALQGSELDQVVAALRTVEAKRLAYTLDQVYELAVPVGDDAVRLILTELFFDRPFVWRYVKSIFRRSMLRHDAKMFGWLAHRIESQGRTTTGREASVKSGYDGVERETTIFSRKTQLFVRRLGWRYMRNLARYLPEKYTIAAAEAILHYSVDDGRDPRGLVGQFADCYLLNRVLHDNSDRLRFDDRRLRFRFRNVASIQQLGGIREEAYPHLWDSYPRPYLRILGSARLSSARNFASGALSRHIDLLPSATADELVMILDSPDEETVKLALAEITIRFSADTPDWQILDRCVSDTRPIVLESTRQWVSQFASFWSRDVDRMVAYLGCQDRPLRETVIESAIAALSADHSLRERFVDRVLLLIDKGEGDELDAIGRVARACLTEELGQRLSRTEMLAMIFHAAPAIQAVAANVLCTHVDHARLLTPQQWLAIATHEVAAVRQAAYQLIESDPDRLRDDPDILFLMLDSDWEDARQTARRFLDRHVDWSDAGFDRVMGLLDSNRTDIQDYGREIVERHRQSFDPVLLATRLSEHPHPNMRRLSMRMIAEEIPDGAEALRGLQHFFRVVLLELSPDRKARDQLIGFLTERGLRDFEQAKIASGQLEMMLHSQGRLLFEDVLQGITRLKIRWPELESSIAPREEAPS